MEDELAFMAAMKLRGDLNVALNALSMVCALIVVLLICGIMYCNSEIMNRLSIRFTLAISIIDFIRSGVIIRNMFFMEDGATCTFFSFLIHWLTLIYMFLNVVVTANLHLVFVLGKIFNPAWETIYWTSSFVSATLLLSVPLIAGKLGFDDYTGSCEFKDRDLPETQIWVWSTFLFWIAISCLYCLVIVILSIIRLQQKVTVLNRLKNNENTINKHISLENSDVLQNNLRKLIRRVALYCIIPTITHIGFLVHSVYSYFIEEPSAFILFLSSVGTSLPGVFNLIAFLMDPAFTTAVNFLRKSTHVEKTIDIKKNGLFLSSSMPLKSINTKSKNITNDTANTSGKTLQHPPKIEPTRKSTRSSFLNNFQPKSSQRILSQISSDENNYFGQEVHLLKPEFEQQDTSDFIRGL